jgi:uncharacterized protein YndB with AHSA1/START domain
MSDTDFVVDKDNLEVRISRTFNATPERVWQAHTEPDQIVQWWSDTVVDKFELKVGVYGALSAKAKMAKRTLSMAYSRK